MEFNSNSDIYSSLLAGCITYYRVSDTTIIVKLVVYIEKKNMVIT